MGEQVDTRTRSVIESIWRHEKHSSSALAANQAILAGASEVFPVKRELTSCATTLRAVTRQTARMGFDLLPREIDKLQLISLAGQLAQKRLARGCRLNTSEATGLISHVLQELIRDGNHSVAELMSMGASASAQMCRRDRGRFSSPGGAEWGLSSTRTVGIARRAYCDARIEPLKELRGRIGRFHERCRQDKPLRPAQSASPGGRRQSAG